MKNYNLHKFSVMKKAIIVFSAFILIAALMAAAYNNGKNGPKQTVGITELPLPRADSLVERGKQLTANYNHKDLQAIAAYLNTR